MRSWTPEMAYVLGYLFADGSMYKSARGSYINVTSIDKSTIEKIKSLLKSEHTIREVKPKIVHFNHQSKNYKTKTAYTLRIGNRALYEDLLRLGMYPNKSLTIGFPDVPTKALPHFVRGYFDGDGCVYLEKGKGLTQESILKRLSVIFTSGSEYFLTGLREKLEESMGISQGKVYNGNGAYRLRYNTKDTMGLFSFMYKNSHGLSLKRKFDIFKAYFHLRPSRVDRNIEKVLKQIGHVAN